MSVPKSSDDIHFPCYQVQSFGVVVDVFNDLGKALLHSRDCSSAKVFLINQDGSTKRIK